MRLCHVATTEICPTFFTVQYQVWRNKRKEICGDTHTSVQTLPSTEMHDEYDFLNQQLLTVKFSKYSDYEGKVLTSSYKVFLFLIVSLFMIVMAEEIERVLLWWRVLPRLASVGGLHQSLIPTGKDDNKHRVEGITEVHRWSLMILVQVPRTVFTGALVVAGARYLILSDGYEELILNSLALTFLVTVDELVCAAFTPKRRKEWIDNCRLIEVPAAEEQQCVWFHWLLDKLCTKEIFLLLTFATSGAIIGVEYTRRYGKQTLARTFRCMCQVAGEDCVAAQLMGGHANLEVSPNYDAGYIPEGSWFGF
jgi:hypothetical protein